MLPIAFVDDKMFFLFVFFLNEWKSKSVLQSHSEVYLGVRADAHGENSLKKAGLVA